MLKQNNNSHINREIELLSRRHTLLGVPKSELTAVTMLIYVT